MVLCQAERKDTRRRRTPDSCSAGWRGLATFSQVRLEQSILGAEISLIWARMAGRSTLTLEDGLARYRPVNTAQQDRRSRRYIYVFALQPREWPHSRPALLPFWRELATFCPVGRDRQLGWTGKGRALAHRPPTSSPPRRILRPLGCAEKLGRASSPRSGKVDPEICEGCGQKMRVIAAITHPHQDDVIERILKNRGQWDPPWLRERRARGPPRQRECFHREGSQLPAVEEEDVSQEVPGADWES